MFYSSFTILVGGWRLCDSSRLDKICGRGVAGTNESETPIVTPEVKARKFQACNRATTVFCDLASAGAHSRRLSSRCHGAFRYTAQMGNRLSLDRRSFLAWIGALPAAQVLLSGDVPAGGTAQGGDAPKPSRGEPSVLRGLAKSEDLLLAPGLAYLQTGSVGPSPRPVVESAVAAWMELEKNPVLHAYKLDLPALEEVRNKAATLLRCTHDEIILTRSTTDGMNATACSLDLASGDRVITTNQEHGGGRNCWEYLARRRGIVLDEIAVPPGENDVQAIIDRFRGAITPRTRVLSFSHILFSTGLRMPVAELCALAREHDCLSVVDGAQAAGAVEVDVRGLGCDVYATTGHKWLLGPKGTGLLFLREGARSRVQLIAEQDGRKAQSESTGLIHWSGMLGLGAAIDYVSAIGLRTIEAYNLEMRNRLFEMLGKVPRVRVVSPAPGPLASPMVSVQLPESVSPGEILSRLLEKHGVVVKGLPTLPNGIRFSTHLFNSVQDIERAIEGLRIEIS